MRYIKRTGISVIKVINSPVDESTKELLFQASISEYNAMRQEQNNMLSLQTSFLTMSITITGVLFGFGFKLFDGDDPQNPMLKYCLFSIIFPAILMTLGCLWLDLAYRQMRLAAYMYNIEERVNNLLGIKAESKKEPERAALYWEHYVKADSKSDEIIMSAIPIIKHIPIIRSIPIRVNQMHYYVCLGLYLFSPILFFLFDYFILKTGIPGLWGYIVFPFYALYVFFISIYVKKILSIHPSSANNASTETEKNAKKSNIKK